MPSKLSKVKLVVDAGILFTGLTGEGVTKKLLFSDNIKLFAPEFLLDEIKEHLSRIVDISSLPEKSVSILIGLFEKRITLISRFEFEEFLNKANSLISDVDDTEYLALALSLDCSIWSNDEHFKKQSEVNVFTTDELVKCLKSKDLF